MSEDQTIPGQSDHGLTKLMLLIGVYGDLRQAQGADFLNWADTDALAARVRAEIAAIEQHARRMIGDTSLGPIA